MKLHIEKWSYWLGLASGVIALVMRTFNAVGIWLPAYVVEGKTIWYMSFFKAALLFLIINIATVLRIYLPMLAEQRSKIVHHEPVLVSRQTPGQLRAASVGA
jgi:Mg/Co/Ni transporter MgtE